MTFFVWDFYNYYNKVQNQIITSFYDKLKIPGKNPEKYGFGSCFAIFLKNIIDCYFNFIMYNL